ncbi:hypothetical protein LSH36_1739g00011 [Paralvinella palmiformis]|uniref:SAM domain-containing protein n=1 Tax=Paralvinella palmiformis TaxID=53620 RepID=A0AAD9MPK7_9ANNE|nr:hypothetical protein LSH36_1739g00011 [Paralvinella palmiformis]
MDLIGSDGDDLLPKLTDREIKGNDPDELPVPLPAAMSHNDTEYTPRELLENFHQNMPFIIMATIYWVKGIIRLPRVIVANKFNAYFSIPITCKFPVVALRDGSRDIMIFDAKPKQGHYDMLLPDRYATFSRVNEGISKGDNHIYMPLIGNSSKTNLERPLPNLPAAATKRDQSPEKQKRHLGQATKSPPMRELFYGGSRGPETGIGQLIGRGYSIMNVNPKLAVQEIQKVLSTGLIPLKPSVEMVDITVGSKPESPSVITEPMKVRSGVVSDNLPRIDATSSFMNELESRQISILNDVPGDLSLLDCDGVGQCLDLLHLAKHRQRFFEALVDGRLLLDLDVEILQNEFGFSKFEALKLVKFVGGWRPITQKPIDCGEC